MSAILPGAPKRSALLDRSLGPDGIRRYKTRCKVIVDSHVSANENKQDDVEIEIFDDVYGVEASKTIKGSGQATVTLIPSKNYLNLIFPNDYINIYFDIGDGSGWTRTFFGFVDRVEEAYAVDKSGIPTTTYVLHCTDFYKALERTMIYFNPHLAGRRDFISYDFNKINIGGLALMSKGIVAGGSPPDIITNVLQLLIGFGTQFILPSSYNPGSTQDRLRRQRAELVYGQLNKEALEKLSSVAYNYGKIRNEADSEAATTFSSFETGVGDAKEKIRSKQLAKSLGISQYAASSLLDSKTDEQIIQLMSDKSIDDQLGINKEERGLTGTDSAQQSSNRGLLDSTISPVSSLSDILDTFTFVERRAIDGYMFGQPVWQKQGSLVSILRSYSNEAVNELFFDLRPLSSEGRPHSVSSKPLALDYSITRDDKRGNREEGTSTAGVTYIPAVVMREYPFSTIEGLDLSSVDLQIKDNETTGELGSIGYLYFGSIFNDNPNIPGRHVVMLDNINIADKAFGGSTELGYKHLDVAVISEEEVVSTTLGRSDNDHFNLFEFYSDNILGSDQRFYMRDMLPIITPIQLLRNGIRVRSVTTRAARFSIDAIRNTLNNEYFENIAAELEAAEAGEEEETILATNLLAPVYSDPDMVRYYDSSAQAAWGYRLKHPEDEEQQWIFHQGIDIYKRPLENVPDDRKADYDERIPIRAIADGEVVISAPDGCYKGYGNVVVIRHDFKDIGIRYSVYAHLDSIEPGQGLGILRSKGRIGHIPNHSVKGKAPGVARGRHPRGIKIKANTVLGYMGNTGFTAPKGEKFHLHFEIDRVFPPLNNARTPRILTSTSVANPGLPNQSWRPSGIDQALMAEAKQNSCDPVSFYNTASGQDLEGLINNGSLQLEEYVGEPEGWDGGNDTDEEKTQRPKDSKDKETEEDLTDDPDAVTSERGLVDTAHSRTQIIRWALLQDHWYQHNLEYLSGRINMRGAPEIRVGYRLDLVERDMSFYVEGVNHKWSFPNNMATTLSVSRGQPNNPYPLYVYPNSQQINTPSSQRRTAKSRLANFFLTPDPIAIRRSLFVRGGKTVSGGVGDAYGHVTIGATNTTDAIYSYTLDENNIHTGYNELVAPAGTVGAAIPESQDGTINDERSKQAPVSGLDSRDRRDPQNPLENK